MGWRNPISQCTEKVGLNAQLNSAKAEVPLLEVSKLVLCVFRKEIALLSYETSLFMCSLVRRQTFLFQEKLSISKCF